MAELVVDCPRCGAKQITFDVTHDHLFGQEYGEKLFEGFCTCRHCRQSTIFALVLPRSTRLGEVKSLVQIQGSLNLHVRVLGDISAKSYFPHNPPEHLPQDIADIFREGATCLAVECYNAAATMFRLCLDMATRERLPREPQEGPNKNVRRSLGRRLELLFNNKHLPKELESLSSCVREDGNDGAHEGTLSKEDAEDLLDFTEALLERLYTEPARLQLAEERRKARRNKPAEE